MHPRFVIRAALDVFAESLFPSRCASCDARVPPRVLFCVPCALSVVPAREALASFAYGGAVAAAVKRFKYGGRSDLAVPLGRALGVWAKARVTPQAIDAVVAVPLHPRKRVERGFEQAELLAHEVARALGRPRLPGALARTRATSAQASLPRDARFTNVDGAFACVDARAVRGRRILLVDDVVTTGATLGACGKALEEAGAARVRVAAVALRDDEGP